MEVNVWQRAMWAMLAACLLWITVIQAHTAHHTPDNPSFHDNKVVHDAEHIAEHLEGVAEMNATQMSPEELEFHYFKLHDFDNNTMLDGLEIYKAFSHLLPMEDDEEGAEKVDPTGKTDEQVDKEQVKFDGKYFEEIVDNILEEDDINNDGYLSYTEYIIARRREELKQERSKN